MHMRGPSRCFATSSIISAVAMPVLEQVIGLVEDRVLQTVDEVAVDGALQHDRLAAVPV